MGRPHTTTIGRQLIFFGAGALENVPVFLFCVGFQGVILEAKKDFKKDVKKHHN